MYKREKVFSYPYIYEPAEDSFLIINFIEENAPLFYNKDVLDMGTGSGILSVKAADSGANVTSVDINSFAIERVRKKFGMKYRKKIAFKVSNLFSNIRKKFDIIMFNPPYLPMNKKEDKDIAMAVSGGKHGYELIQDFFSKVNRYLKDEGFILLVFSSLTNKEKVEEVILKHGFKFELLKKENFDFETLFLYKIEKKNFLKLNALTDVLLFAKGKRGLVYKADLRLNKRTKKEVAIKTLRQDTEAVNVIEKEGEWLLFLNRYKIGPKVVLKKDDFLIMEFIRGKQILDYFKEQDYKKSIFIIKKIIRQCILLDLIGVDKEELHHPLKHIIIRNGRPVMIDFERTHFTKKPKNTTQFIQFLSSRYVKNALGNKAVINASCLRQVSKEYKSKIIKIFSGISPDYNIKVKRIYRQLNNLSEFLIPKVSKCIHHKSDKNNLRTQNKRHKHNFYDKVYNLVKRIPEGRVSTYKIIAEKLNSKAYRAVGTALHKNPYREVPCHRVVKSNGEIGGFARGTKEKVRMLKKEGLSINKNKIKNFEGLLYKF